MFSVATADTQLFANSASKVTEKNLSNLQKRDIYKIENSEWASIHPIAKVISVCYYYQCLSGKQKIKLILLLCTILL